MFPNFIYHVYALKIYNKYPCRINRSCSESQILFWKKYGLPLDTPDKSVGKICDQKYVIKIIMITEYSRMLSNVHNKSIYKKNYVKPWPSNVQLVVCLQYFYGNIFTILGVFTTKACEKCKLRIDRATPH